MLPLLRLLAIAIFTIVCAGVAGSNHGSSSTVDGVVEAQRALAHLSLGAGVAPKTTHQVRDHDSRRPLDVAAEADLDDDDSDDDTDSKSHDAQHQLVAVDDLCGLHGCRSSSFFGAAEIIGSRIAIRPGLPRGPPRA
jgi:hypothetical protein